MDLSDLVWLLMTLAAILYSISRGTGSPLKEGLGEEVKRKKEKTKEPLPPLPQQEMLHSLLQEEKPVAPSPNFLQRRHPEQPARIANRMAHLRNLQDLVIYQEVMGPPKSLRKE